MAGGYICKKFEWDGGRTDTHNERCAFVLKGCAQALLDTNTGWALDTAKNATLDDYTQASGDKIYEGSAYVDSPCYMLFFTSTSGAKLMLGYRYGFSRYGTSRAAAIDNSYILGTWQAMGLFASIIPPGSSDDFSTTAPYVSTDATRIAFTSQADNWTTTYGSSLNYSFAFGNDVNVTFRYFFITNGINLIVLNNSNYSASQTGVYNGFICGRIFSTLFNDPDDTKKGGAFAISLTHGYTSTALGREFYEKLIYDSSASGINLETGYFAGATGSYYLNFINFRCYQKADGTWENVMTTASPGPYFGASIRSDTDQLGSNVGTKRWVPMYMYGASTDTTVVNHEIVAGCGNTLKGYIDPDLARIVNNNSRYARGTTFDNGNLIYLGGGLAVGWDPSNTVAIF